MFTRTRLRTKILLPLLALSLIPLVLTLVVVSRLSQHQIEKSMQMRKSDISNFVERNTTYTQAEKFNCCRGGADRACRSAGGAAARLSVRHPGIAESGR